MGEELEQTCSWCGKRTKKGYHGDSKSIFMRKYRFYCSIDCKNADSLPDELCAPAVLIPFEIFLIVWWFFEGATKVNSLGFLGVVVLLSVLNLAGLWFVREVLLLRKKIPKGSRLD